YHDIAWISRNPQIFSNAQRLRLAEMPPYNAEAERIDDQQRRYRAADNEPPDLVLMDPPDHRQYRSLVSKWFTPKAMMEMEDHLTAMSQQYVGTFGKILADRLRESSGAETDFVHDC